MSTSFQSARIRRSYDLYVSLFLYSGFGRFTAFHVSKLLFARLFQLSFLLAKVGFCAAANFRFRFFAAWASKKTAN